MRSAGSRRHGRASATLALEPQRADAHNNSGLALAALRKPQEALASYDKALTLDPNHLRALHNRATVLVELKVFDQALAACDRVLALDPQNPDTLNTRGIVLNKLKRPVEALASYDAALAQAPGRNDIESNRGTVLLDLDRFAGALASFERVLAGEPENIGALINHGNTLIKLKRPAEALAQYEKALAREPDHAIALTARGVALTLLDRFEEALELHERALRVDRDLVSAHINRGNTLASLARMPEAISSYDGAIAREAENAEGNFNAAITRLCLGDFQAGWKQYEYRWKKKDIVSQWQDFSAAVVARRAGYRRQDRAASGRAGPGRYPSIHALCAAGRRPRRQGHSRRAAAADRRGEGRCRAFRPCWPTVSRSPDFDFHCPLLSLPLAFATDLATIPANVPYLRPYADRVAIWQEKLPQNGRLRVGLCWSGSNAHLNDRNRSMPLSPPGFDAFPFRTSISSACKKK